MADYIDRQMVTDAVRNVPAVHGSEGSWCNQKEVLDVINDLPSADVVDVVRCADCKHSYESVAGWICSHGVCVDCVVRDDFYCSYGERNEAS